MYTYTLQDKKDALDSVLTKAFKQYTNGEVVYCLFENTATIIARYLEWLTGESFYLYFDVNSKSWVIAKA